MIDTLTNTWRDILAPQLKQPYFQQLQQFLQQQYKEETVFPKKSDVMTALISYLMLMN